MALSGLTSKSYTPSAAFWVWVEWTATQDVVNNRSTITAITYGGSNSYGYYNGTNKWGYTTIAGNTTSVKYTDPWAASTTKRELHRQVRTIDHNADGTKGVTIGGRWTAGSDPEGSFFDISSSGTFTLDTIPSATQPAVNPSSATLGSSVTISTPRASETFTHTLKYAIGALNGTIATSVGISYSWTPPAALAAAITGGTSGTATITCETYSGATLVGTKTVSLTITVPNTSTYWPTAAISSVTEGAAGLSAFTVFIQGKSKFRVQSSGTGKYSATIAQYKVTIDGFNYYGADITSALITKSGTIAVSLTVTDSRGYTATVSQNMTVQAYAAPVITTFTASRSPTDQDTNLSVPINFSISTLSNQNTKFYQIRYRPSGGAWVVLTSSTAYYTRSITHTGTGVLNTMLAYEVEFTVSDYFTSVVRTLAISTAFDLINFNASGRGIAFGRVSSKDEMEVDLPVDVLKPMKLTGVNLDLVGGKLLHGGIERPHDFLIASGTDLNNLTGTGTYYCPANATVATLLNCPTGNAFSMIVSKHAGFSQLLIPYPTASHDIYHRNYYNGTWGAWQNIYGLSTHTHSSLTAGSQNYSYTDYGYISFGPQNGSWAHIYTDRPNFYFNKDLYVNGYKARTIVASSGDAKNGYEKYNNGYARAWKTVSTTVLASSMVATGPTGTYKSGWIAIGTWPITFTTAPRTDATLAVIASAWTWLGSLKAATTTDAGEFLIYKFAQSDSAIEFYIEGYGPA